MNLILSWISLSQVGSLKMKLLIFLAFTLLAVNVFVVADDEEEGMLQEMLEDEMVKDEPYSEEGIEPRFARDVRDDVEEDEEENEEPMSDSIEDDAPVSEENDEETAPLEPEEAFDEAEKDEAVNPE